MKKSKIIALSFIILSNVLVVTASTIDDAIIGLQNYAESFTLNVEGTTEFEYECISLRKPMNEEEAEKWVIKAVQFSEAFNHGQFISAKDAKQMKGFYKAKERYQSGYENSSSFSFKISPIECNIKIFDADEKLDFELVEHDGIVELLEDGETNVNISESNEYSIYLYFFLKWYYDLFQKPVDLNYETNANGNLELSGHNANIDVNYVVELSAQDNFYVPIKYTVTENKKNWSKVMTYNNYVYRGSLLLPSYVTEKITPRDDRLGPYSMTGPVESIYMLKD